VYLIWQQVGVAALAGLGVTLLMIPFQSWFSRAFGRLRHRMALISDERVRLITQVRAVVMRCWTPLSRRYPWPTFLPSVGVVLCSHSTDYHRHSRGEAAALGAAVHCVGTRRS
jgi:hypothetical protein